MAAPDFIAAASNSSAGSTTASVVIPTSGPGGAVVAGMRALLVLTLTPAAPTADPAGWSAVVDTFASSTNSGGRMYLWECEIGSSGDVDPGDTVTVALDGNCRWALGMVIYEDSEITLPVGVFAPVPGTSGNMDGTLTSPGATTVDDSRVVHIYGVNSNVGGEQPTWAAHALTAERVDITSSHGSSRNATLLIADEVVAGAGSAPGRTAVSSLRVQPTAMTVVLTVAVDRPVAVPSAPQTVAAGNPFTLSVTALNGAGAPFTYAWTQIAGSTTPLDDPTSQSPSATAGSQSETLEYCVVVTDADGVESLPAKTTVTVLGASNTAVPVSDIVVSGWETKPPNAATLSAVLADASDATYAYVEDPVGTVVLEVGLSALHEPANGEPYTLSWRPSIFGASQGSATVYLKQGATTVIAVFGPDVWTENGVVQQFDHELSEAQIASITDWSDLRVRIEGSVIV